MNEKLMNDAEPVGYRNKKMFPRNPNFKLIFVDMRDTIFGFFYYFVFLFLSSAEWNEVQKKKTQAGGRKQNS